MIVIHIGGPKAGSTTIQKFLGQNVESLRQIGLDYPNIGLTKRGYHLNIFYELRDHRNFDKKRGTIDDLVKNIKTKQYPITVLSAEALHRCSRRQVKTLKSKLSQADQDIEIIFVVRDLVELMPSAYSQPTKVGDNLLDFDTYFDAGVMQQGQTFLETLKVWGSVFGWDRVRVRPLDRNLLVNGDLVDDFLATAGIDPSACDFQRSEKTNVANASPGWRVLEAFRALFTGNHGLPAGHPLSRSLEHSQTERKFTCRTGRVLADEIGWNVDRGRYLTSAQAQQCVAIHGEAIDALNALHPYNLPQPLGLEARGFVEREFLPEASQMPAQDLRGFYDELASRVANNRQAAVSALAGEADD